MLLFYIYSAVYTHTYTSFILISVYISIMNGKDDKKDIWTDIPRVHRTTLSIYHAFVGKGGLIDKKEDEMNQPPLVCPNILGANNVFFAFLLLCAVRKKTRKKGSPG